MEKDKPARERRLMRHAMVAAVILAGVVALTWLEKASWTEIVPGGQSVTEEELVARLTAEGWSDVKVNRRDNFIVVGDQNGKHLVMIVDPKTGRGYVDED
jgi:hypothetical protein